jgi:hypothetical protein
MKADSLRVQRFILLAALALLAMPFLRSQEAGTLTLLKDTQLRVIRGFSVTRGVEGMQLRQGDILETGAEGTAQAQLELSGGAIVELGPSSQAYIYSQSPAAAEIVLLTGWLKGETTSGSYRYSSPLVSASTKGGNVLLHVTGDSADVFVERGAASIGIGGSTPMPSSADKLFFTRRAGKPIAAAGRPSQDFVSAMPVCFRDVSPPRISHFASAKPPTPRSDHEVSYGEIDRWLSSGWGKGLVGRFKPRLQDIAFRQAIEAHLAALPEWEPILHPQ